MARIAGRLKPFPAYARVRSVWLTCEPWTVEAGFITPTMKLRRDRLAQRFTREIEALYRNTDRRVEIQPES
jgi:long-chain acyl-CoA synthetase